MILGIGTNLCHIPRVEALLNRFGERFIERCYTSSEKEWCTKETFVASAYAKRFAAKEACAKALGTGVSGGILWREMGIVNDPDTGQPTLHLTGTAQEYLYRKVPKGYVARLHVSLTDDPPFALAFVMIEALHHSDLFEKL